MSDDLKNGGPAFPVKWNRDYKEGMTLRDYMAGQALAGMSRSTISPGHASKKQQLDAIVGAAYEIADAMLEQRGKDGT